jgi:glycosyltransferase involved in cell wall biosynthesis
MRIGIDGACWTNRRGYGRFLRELASALARVDCANEYVLFLDSATEALPPAVWETRHVGVGRPAAEAARFDGRRSLADLWRMRRAAAAEPLDLFFFPTVYSYFPLAAGPRALVGVHDTIAENHPRLAFGSRRNEWFWRAKVRAALRRADRLLTVSEYSRRSIERVYGCPGERIDVAYEAPAEVFRQSREAAAREDFVLAAGGISPTKNLATLIEAFAIVAPGRPGLRLKLAGDDRSDPFRTCGTELRGQAARLGLSARVDFLGYVPDEELAALHRRTRLFAMPSLDEGFGLPAVEAMACGAPVAVASGHALEEVAGDAALVLPPNDPRAWAETIGRVLSDDVLAADLSRRSLARAARFDWDETARAVLASFAACVNVGGR